MGSLRLRPGGNRSRDSHRLVVALPTTARDCGRRLGGRNLAALALVSRPLVTAYRSLRRSPLTVLRTRCFTERDTCPALFAGHPGRLELVLADRNGWVEGGVNTQ